MNLTMMLPNEHRAGAAPPRRMPKDECRRTNERLVRSAVPVGGCGWIRLADSPTAMKSCTYCGRDNDDAAAVCRECGTEFLAAGTSHSEAPAVHPSKVVMWLKVYAGVMCFTYLAGAAFSLFFFFADPADTEMSPTGARIFGVLFLLLNQSNTERNL